MVQRWFLVWLILTFTVNQVIADAGYCFKYEVKVTLNNDTVVQGLIYILDRENPWDKDHELSFEQYVHAKSPEGEVLVYQNVETFTLRELYASGKEIAFESDMTSSESVITIRLEDLNAVEMLRMMPCSQERTGLVQDYFWNGIYPPIISELTISELSNLASTDKVSYRFLGNHPDYPVEYWVVRTSELPLRGPIYAMMMDFLNETREAIQDGDWSSVPTIYSDLKRDFRDKGMILLKLEHAI